MTRSARPVVLAASIAVLVLAVGLSQGALCACARAQQLPGLNPTETQNVQLVIRNLDALVTTFEAAGQNAGQGNNPEVEVVVRNPATGMKRTVNLNDDLKVEVAQYRQVLTKPAGQVSATAASDEVQAARAELDKMQKAMGAK